MRKLLGVALPCAFLAAAGCSDRQPTEPTGVHVPPLFAAISPVDFGAGALVESFEGLTAGPNISANVSGLLNPGVVGPFTFPSGVTLTEPIPNPVITHPFGEGVVIGDFAIAPAGWGICAVPGDPTLGNMTSADQVPDGSAYMGLDGEDIPLVEFTFPSDMLRVGAFVTAAFNADCNLDAPEVPITLSAFDASGVLLETVSVGTVFVLDWGSNFLGVENAAGIRKVRFSGAFMILDALTFELSPAVAVAVLVDAVIDLNLKTGLETSLDAKLEAAFQALADINENNNVAAINSLQAFINAVEAQRGKNLSDAEADTLIAAAQQIIAQLSG